MGSPKIKFMKLYEPHFNPIGHLYHDDAGMVLDSVTTIIKDELGLYQYGNMGAATRGTAVHRACEYLDQDDLEENTVAEDIMAYVEQYKLAKAKHNIVTLQCEVKRYSPKYLFAGGIDRVATVEGIPSVIDLKTGKEEPWHFIQLGAYGELIRAEYPVEKYYDLYLYPADFLLVEQDGKRGFSYFLALLAAHNIKKNLGYIKPKKGENQ